MSEIGLSGLREPRVEDDGMARPGASGNALLHSPAIVAYRPGIGTVARFTSKVHV
ncbi:MAG: hypothetical protein Q8R28_16750 [Dehalococcoidia bacterium]|nr:hypothetical protein [Dehalococcoidia bacterium]